jgi:tetratricopeptide (TPR) repeat protein
MKIGAMLLLLGLTPALVSAQDSTQAQATTLEQRVGNAVRTAFPKFEAADCSADKDLHFKVKSVKVYLVTASDRGVVEGNQTRALNNGKRVSLEAIQQNGQEKSAGAWYYLGRVYLLQGDLAGADSAFDRAETLAPDCKADIAKYRRAAWVVVVNQGISFTKSQQPDSAMAYFQLANRIYAGSPHAYYQMGALAFDQNNMEKALVYFDSALAMPSDSNTVQMHEQAAYNKAVVLLRLQRANEAVPLLQAFVARHPDDINAKKALMSAYAGAGMQDSVNAVGRQLEAAGETVERAAPASSPFNDAVKAFNAEDWAGAVAAAEKVVATEPYNRDVLYILVASDYRLKKGPELVRWAKQLTQVDPASESALQMLGFGYNLTKDSKNAVATRLKFNSLPFAMADTKLDPSASGATFTATATGRSATDANGKAIAPHPVTITVEFLNKDGASVATADVAVPALKAGETFDVSAQAQGEGITAWRYSLK